MTEKTESIFQYRPPAAWAYENLCSAHTYFSSPLKFNDPFDCRIPPMLHDGDLTDERLAFLRRTNPEVWGINPEDKHLPKADFIAKINDKLREIHKEEINRCGVACFSKRNDNLLMWAHYAGGDKGFCLEFDRNGDELYKGHDVNYSDTAPDAYPYIKALAKKQETGTHVELLLTRKDEIWKDEEEVRLFRGEVDIKSYPSKILKAIYLGFATTKATEKLIRAIIAKKRYRHVKLKKANPGKDRRKAGFTILRG